MGTVGTGDLGTRDPEREQELGQDATRAMETEMSRLAGPPGSKRCSPSFSFFSFLSVSFFFFF